MNKYIKNQLNVKNYKNYTRLIYLFIVLLSNSNLDLNSGSDFVAIKIPDSFYNYFKSITKYAKDNLISRNRIRNPVISEIRPKNLHITLKEIGELNNHERAIVIKKLGKIAEHIPPCDIFQAIKKGRLHINSNAIKLMLYDQDWLINVSDRIDSALRDLFHQGKIKALKARLDFPKYGHIILAKVENLPRNFGNKIKNIEQKFQNKFHKRFVVNKIYLLKSNRPKLPRVYFEKSEFKLGPVVKNIKVKKKKLLKNKI